MVSRRQVSKEDRVDIHKNARLTPHSRAELVRRVLEQGQSSSAVADAFGVCQRTVREVSITGSSCIVCHTSHVDSPACC